ncbi:MAG: DUF4132 domain-containing protein [Propionibacteriaceae bacterium]|nr:DUF4132 domain-containing protein [Propionibacteriaceae bacterium]
MTHFTMHPDPDQIGWNVTPFDLAMNLNAEVTVEDDTERFDPEQELARAKRIATLHKDPNGGSFGAQWVPTVHTWTFTEPPFTKLPSAERATWWLNYLHDVGKSRHVGVFLPPGVRMALGVRGTMPPHKQDNLSLFVDGHIPRLDTLACRVVLPLLPQEEQARMRKNASLPIPSKIISQGGGWQLKVDSKALVAAASLGERVAEVREALHGIDDGALVAERTPEPQQQVVVLAAATPEERVALADRLGARMKEPHILLAWLIATGKAGFPHALKSLELLERAPAEACLHMLAVSMTGVGAVPFFVDAARGRHPKLAFEWLSANLPAVLQADLTATKAAPLAPVLRTMPTEQLTEALPGLTGGVRKVAEEVLAEKSRPAFHPTAAWWAEAAETVKQVKLPAGLTVMGLPPLTVDDAVLAPAEVEVLLQALAAMDRDQPLVAAVRERAEARGRDEFAVALLDHWLASGAVAKDSWMMVGAGSVAGDSFVYRLVPLIREWPGQSQHQRSVKGLDALRNVGTHTALQQISGIANKSKFAGIKKRAGEAMAEIALGLGFTRDQLEDRVIPNGGLDERGTREFDYGHRRFRANLTPEGKLVARLLDEDGRPTGKVLSTLPAPLKADDPQLAKDAKADFMALKKTVAAIAQIQIKRFEKAMMADRRWTEDEFEEFVISNPLLRSLFSGVVWGLYPEADDAAHTATFRLDEDGSAVDAADEPVELGGHTVGIMHPVAVSSAELSRWGEVQADFELAMPFRQLDRPLYDLPPNQGDNEELQGLPSTKVEPTKLLGAFTKYDWDRGDVLDGGGFSLYWAQFPSAGLTAVIEFSGMWIGPLSEQEPQALERVYLVDGVIDGKVLGFGWKARYTPEAKGLRRVPWSAVPRAVASEVLTVVHAIQA